MAPRMERKLAAILAVDVVGYSRLVGDDEAGTIARLRALRQELIEPLVAEYHGRVVKLMGDGALVEFASAATRSNARSQSRRASPSTRLPPRKAGGSHSGLASTFQGNQTDSLEAYDLYVLANHLLQTGYTQTENDKMEQYYRRAIEKDPGFALAYVGLGWGEMHAYQGGWSPNPQESLQRALEYGQKALALDENQAKTHELLCDVYASMGQLDRGVAEHSKARVLNPNDAGIKSESAAYLAYAGRVDESIELVTDAMRLNPFYPDWFLWNAAIVYYLARRYEAVIDAVERMGNPPADPLLFLAASYAQLGRLTEAQATVKRVLALDPNATVAKFAAQQPYKNPADLEHYEDGLRKAGMPEGGPVKTN